MTELRVAGLVLAAGAGRRLGTPKAVVEVGGVRLVDRAVATLRAGGANPVLVVVGAAEVGRVDALVVHNPSWDDGLGSSLVAGLAALADPGEGQPVDAVVITLVDTVDVAAEAVRRVIAAAVDGARICAARYGRERGHPVLIRREDWPEVARSAAGDAGARTFLQRHADDVVEVPCDDLSAGVDIDTPADLAAARLRFDHPDPQPAPHRN